MAKKSSKKLKHAVQALISAAPRRTKVRRNRATTRMQNTSRSLLHGSIPRPYMSFVRTGDDGIVVRGCEIIAQLNTSSIQMTNSMPLNPLVADVFPRLSSLAQSFERFRFSKVQLRYHTACPATRSGSVGLAVYTEPIKPLDVPLDIPRFATERYSVVGSVAESLATPRWDVKDPEYFYMFGISDANPTTQSLKVYQGTLAWLLSQSVAADAELLAGYLSLEYEVSLITPRPSVQRALASSLDFDISVNRPASLPDVKRSTLLPFVTPSIDNYDVTTLAGPFSAGSLTDTLGPEAVAAWGASGTVDATRPVVTSLGASQWRGTIRISAGPEAAYPSPLPAEIKVGRGISRLSTRCDEKDYFEVKASPLDNYRSEMPIVTYYNPEYVTYPDAGAIPLDPEDRSFDFEKSQDVWIAPHLRGPKAPLADGDFTVIAWAWNRFSKVYDQIQSWVLNPGTAAFIQTLVTTFVLVAEKPFMWQMYPANSGHQRPIYSRVTDFALQNRSLGD